ncbi:MAG TPA: hypothetical protein VGH33_20355, partial [Isosphaeraceae bacterium]
MPRRRGPDDPNSRPPEPPSFDPPPYYHFIRTARTHAHRIARNAVVRRVIGRVDARDHALDLGRYLGRV